jgi:hypothetical protein
MKRKNSRIILPEPFVKWASEALRLANADDAGLRDEAEGFVSSLFDEGIVTVGSLRHLL